MQEYLLVCPVTYGLLSILFVCFLLEYVGTSALTVSPSPSKPVHIESFFILNHFFLFFFFYFFVFFFFFFFFFADSLGDFVPPSLRWAKIEEMKGRLPYELMFPAKTEDFVETKIPTQPNHR